MDKATLFICPTPIGNLKDVTLRVLETLKSVDLIAAEDTRQTVKLLNHYDIKNKLISYHEHNKMKMQPVLINELKDGKNIALVTDAGMPGISDPGSDIVLACIKENINVEVLPGANAAITALVASGLSTESFLFIGFLPKKITEAKRLLENIKNETHTLIFYESPHRLIKILELLNEVLGDRDISIARELTKIHEQFLRLKITGAIDHFKGTDPRGEFVLVVEGAKKDTLKPPADESTIQQTVFAYKEQGLSTKDAIIKAAQELGLSRNIVYKSAKASK